MESKRSPIRNYRIYRRKKIIFLLSSAGLLAGLFLLSIMMGSVHVPAGEIFSVLLKNGEGIKSTIIWNIRLPRILMGLVSGAGLAVAGAAMQSILKNPLGSPYTLGISHAAAFGAAFAIVLLGTGSITGSSEGSVLLGKPYLTTLSAFFWSILSTGVILLLAKVKRASPETLILTGVALGSLFTASTTAIQYFADQVELASIVFWTFGDLGRATWEQLGLVSAVTVPATMYFTKNSWNYNALDSGDETAVSLGVNVERLRMVGMCLASLVTALIVSFVGIIGFVGLVAPHIVRKIIGGEERFLLPASGLVGASLLLGADTAARTVISPVVLPVGILTSFLGAPLFIYLVIVGREYWKD